MQRLSMIVLTGLIALATPSSPSFAGDVVRIPGTHLSLVPPDDFEIAKRFPGVQNEQLRASISVTEIPSGLETLKPGLSNEQLEPRGMSLQETESVSFGSHAGQLARVEQTLNGAVYEKWMGLVGDDEGSVFVVATYPRALSEMLRARMRTSVLSAKWDPKLELDPFDGLPFRLKTPKPFEVLQRTHALLTFSTPGTTIPVPPSEPFVVVGASFNPVEVDDLVAFSRKRLDETVQISDIANVKGASIEIAKNPAYELEADAKDLASGSPLRIYQVIVLTGQDYTIVQGITPADRVDEFLPALRSLARSLEFP